MSTSDTIAETPAAVHSRPRRFHKKERGRKREVDKAAEAMADRHELPESPGKDLKWNQAFEYLKLLTPEMWSHVSVYVYRLKPRIIRQLRDPEARNYIDVLTDTPTLEYFINTHGGGTYLLRAADVSRKEPANQLFKCVFDIDINQYEPKLNYEELDINARENMAYVQMLQHKGILNDKGHVVTNNPQTQSGTNGGLNAEVIKEILGFVSKLTADQQANLRARLGSDDDTISKSVGQILLEKMKQDDPSKQVQMLSGLLTALKEIVGTSKDSKTSDINFAQVFQMQAEQRKTDLEYIKLVLESRKEPNPEGAGQFAQFQQMFNFAKDVMDLGRGGGGQRSGWDVGLDYAKELGVPILQTINNLFSMRNGNPAAPITPNPTGAFDPYRDQAALRAHAASLKQPGQAPPGATPGTAMPPANELTVLLQQSTALLVNALNNGTPGYAFADYFTGLMGTAPHAMISAQGEQALVTAALAIPELAMFGEPRLRTFAKEFINFEEFLAQAEVAEEKTT